MKYTTRAFALLVLAIGLSLNPLFASPIAAEDDASDHLQLSDVFELEYASSPEISPDGQRIVYVRQFMDIMEDRVRGNLWIMNADGSDARPLTSGNRNDGSPVWSADGQKLLYVSSESGTSQIHCLWLDDGHSAVISRLPSAPRGIRWSPDGTQIAFSMFVRKKWPRMITLNGKPEGATWAKPATEITDLRYRADGQGFLTQGNRHLFVLPVDGGTPRQLTDGEFDHGADFCWSPDSNSIVFSANRNEDSEHRPLDSNLFEVSLADLAIKQLTDRDGPDANPEISPDGNLIAYVGFDDKLLGYQVRVLHVMRRDGTGTQVITADLDRSVASPKWTDQGRRLLFAYDDLGTTKLASVTEGGEIVEIAAGVGGTSLGRPYSSGSFSVSLDGAICFTLCGKHHPADVAVVELDGTMKRLTHLNDDLLKHRTLGDVEELWLKSSFDELAIQSWIVKPPHFDPQKKYPLLLEIHGGPFANYGPRFAAEMQLYAAAGYVVLYVNPRGSTSYGSAFGNLIHHRYPGEDYDDLISAVDAVVEQGYVDENRLYVTGGSGGGVLSAWIVGKTDRFRAAVVAKPVINWYSFALTADAYNVFYKYWFPGPPWEYPQQYLDRSPLSLVGNVSTPTMLLTGEEDFRTPMSETEQYYQALKLRKVDTAMIRIPGAGHGITARPSNLMSKVAYVLKWFEMHSDE